MRYDHYLHKTAQTRAVCIEENLSQMRYIDLHCDTLTAACGRGVAVDDRRLQAGAAQLNESECAAQCFAIFTEGDSAANDFFGCLAFYEKCVNDGKFIPVLNGADLGRCIKCGGTGAILTVENLGFLDDIARLGELYSAGVRMASLVWNNENKFAYPNLIFGADGAPIFSARESRGLKPAGRAAVEMLDKLKIIVDVSHLSDGGADEILSGRKIPAVASHSGAAGACRVSRNLTDVLIKKIADCGGVIGIYYCKDFLGDGDTFARVLAHLQHIINVGGEGVVALGSDFDGIPAPPGLETCEKVPALFEYLQARGISAATLEKLCYKNFARVFEEVCG